MTSCKSCKSCSDGRCTCNLTNVSCADYCGCGGFCENTDTTLPVNGMNDEIDMANVKVHITSQEALRNRDKSLPV